MPPSFHRAVLFLLSAGVLSCPEGKARTDARAPVARPDSDRAHGRGAPSGEAADAGAGRGDLGIRGDAGDAGAAPKGGEVCRRAVNPSFPAVAFVAGKAWIAYYDGPSTVVGPIEPGPTLRADRTMPMGGAPPAGPALAVGRRGALLLSVAAAGAGYRLVARRVPADLERLGPEVPLASSVDARYTPAIVAATGGFVIAWVDVSRGVGRAMAGRLRADGRPDGPPRVLSTQASNAGAIALSKAPSGVVAAWIDPRLGFSPLYVARGGAEGGFAEPAVALSTGSVSRTPVVAVAAGERDGIVLAWGHMGPLGQDYLSWAFHRPGAPPPRPSPLSRADAYATLSAAVVRARRGYAVLWDEPTGTGRGPPTAVRLRYLDAHGAPVSEALTLGAGGGVAAVQWDGRILAALRRGASVCVVERGANLPVASPRGSE